jgi:hypothetical protein
MTQTTITVKITETIISTKFAQHRELTKTVFHNKTWGNKIPNERGYVVKRVCDWFTDFSLIRDTNT